MSGKELITIRQWDKLDAIARREHKTVGDVVIDAFKKAIDSLMSDADATEPQK